MAFFYVTLFISLMYLAMRFLAKKTQLKWGPIASVLLGLAAVALATTISLVLHYNLMPRLSHNDFSVYLIGNWYWATWEGSEPGSLLGSGPGLLPFAFLVCVALVPITLAVALASRELLSKPGALPGRVLVDDQQIDQSLGLGRPQQLVKAAPVCARLLAFVLDATRLEHRQHALEVAQLFAGEFRNWLLQKSVLGITEQHSERCPGRLLFAMGVIEQHIIDVADRSLCPGLSRRGGQVQHGGAV